MFCVGDLFSTPAFYRYGETFVIPQVVASDAIALQPNSGAALSFSHDLSNVLTLNGRTSNGSLSVTAVGTALNNTYNFTLLDPDNQQTIATIFLSFAVYRGAYASEG